MALKLYKVSEVCEIAQVQAYVLKSWEKEFPGIGLQKADDSGRLYRQSDLDQVLRIKQLVFGEGLTLAGARRRLEESVPARPVVAAAEVVEVLGAEVRRRIGHVRDGLRSLLELLSHNGDRSSLALSASAGHYELTPPVTPKPAKNRASGKRGKTTRAAKAAGVRGKPAASRKAAPRKRARA